MAKQESLVEKVRQTAVSKAREVADLTDAGIRSGAYTYPVKGVLFLASHPTLWKPLRDRAVSLCTLGAGVTAVICIFGYLPQAAALTFVQGPVLAAVSAGVLVMSESAAVTTALARYWILGGALTDLFDATLVAVDQTDLVAEGREIKSSGSGSSKGKDPFARMGRVLKKPAPVLAGFASAEPWLHYAGTLALNLVPVIGTALFLLERGKHSGPAAHQRYFQLKNLSGEKQSEFVDSRRAAYTSFGVASVLLDFIPAVGLVFAFTNVVGAALWAADLERTGTTAPDLKSQAKRATS